MKLLFVHQNFPGQFKNLVPAMLADKGNTVVGFTMRHVAPMDGLQVVHYKAGRSSTKGIHPWMQDTESKVIRGQVALKAAFKIRDEHGFVPDVILAHHGWGEALFLKHAWPDARLALYCEWYYPLQGADVNFDPEFLLPTQDNLCRLRMKNSHNLLSMEQAVAGISPTQWQASTHPDWFKPRIEVIHDGIDTDRVCPAQPGAEPLTLPIPADEACRIETGSITLQPGDEIISFVNRNLEPYRGYHIFMRALPELLRRRPNAKVVIVGANGVSYGAPAPHGSWKQTFLDEVRGELDMSRIAFVGNIPYPSFLRLLQLTTVHVYLTYPFVLSWSLLEAMASGGAIVASDTEPVREVITDGETGRLVQFFDREALVERVCELLDDPAQRKRLGQNARDLCVSRYDLKRICLPAQQRFIERVARS